MSRRRQTPRHTVTVQIGGEKHVLRSDAPPEYTHTCAAHLDATLRTLPGYPLLDPQRAAVLAALSITDELLRTREELQLLRDEAARRADALAGTLEDAVGGEAPPPEAPGPESG